MSKQQQIPEVAIVLQSNVRNAATRTYNKPSANEVAAIVPTGAPEKSHRSVTIT